MNDKAQEMPDSKFIFEMINSSIGDLNSSLKKLDSKIDKEMEKNATRHLKLIEKSADMRGDIKMVSAKVAGVISASGIVIGYILKKFGI